MGSTREREGLSALHEDAVTSSLRARGEHGSMTPQEMEDYLLLRVHCAFRRWFRSEDLLRVLCSLAEEHHARVTRRSDCYEVAQRVVLYCCHTPCSVTSSQSLTYASVTNSQLVRGSTLTTCRLPKISIPDGYELIARPWQVQKVASDMQLG